jgi:hypothetical protein
LEHSDLQQSGALFVKFHTSDRATFEKHIKARWKHGYHRGDPVAKNATHLGKRFEHEHKKWHAKVRYLRNRIRGQGCSIENVRQHREVFWFKRLIRQRLSLTRQRSR